MAQEQIKPKEERAEQPVYVLTPVESPLREDGKETTLADLIRILWRGRYLVLTGTLLCGLAAFLVSSLMPEVYEATATMIVTPPPFATELKLPALPVEAYQAIAQSRFILHQVEKALLERDPTFSGSLEFEAFIRLSRENRNPSYLPLLDLTARAPTARQAELAANIWAEVLSAETADLAERGKKGTLDFIQQQFPETAKSLTRREEALKERQDHFDSAALQLENNWGEELLRYQNETGDLLREYQTETERLLLEFNNQTARLEKENRQETERLKLEFLDRWKPDLMKRDLGIKKNKLSKFEDDLLDTDLAVKSLKDRLAQLQAGIQTQPPVLVLSKAVTDEVLWEQIVRSSPNGLPESIEALKMRSEIINPVHMKLREELAKSQVEHDTLIPRKEHLQDEISRVRKEIDRLSVTITEKEIELSDLLKSRALELELLQTERRTGLRHLIDERSAGQTKLNRERRVGEESLIATNKFETERLARQAGLEVGRLTREKERAKESYHLLGQKYEEAVLARSEEDRDLKVGALATLPRLAIKPMLMLNTVIALVAGLVLCVSLVFVLAYARALAFADGSPAAEASRRLRQ